jgi:Xaa-Pro aminopeptidase
VSGLPRPRNFAGNQYPFRAESHFLYFVGRPLRGAALLVRPDGALLYAEPPDPEAALWTGREPSLEELATELSLEVRPIAELSASPDTATLPAQDAETAAWQSDLLGREIDPGSGPELEGRDRELAERVIDLRLVHDEPAIEQVRRAARVTDRAHRAGMRATRPGLR